MKTRIRSSVPAAGAARLGNAEEAARLNESLFRAVFEASNDAIFILTEDGFIDCNPQAVRMFGFDGKDAAIHAHPVDISPPLQPDGNASNDAAARHIQAALGGSVERFEWMHRRCSGENFPAEVLLSPFDLGGRTVLQATVRDITRRRQAERALQEKSEELNKFFDLALDLLCIADTDGYFLRLNRSWETTLGYDAAELTRHRFLEFIHPDDVAATVEAISALSSQQPVINFVNRYRCSDGSYKHIEWRSVPSGDKIYAAARDISEHVLAELQLRTMNETLDRRVAERTQQLAENEALLRTLNAELETRVEERTASLEAANRELEAFSYSVSHDLRAPLRHINGFVELLQEAYTDVLDDRGRRLLQTIADAACDMGTLIDELLVFSRMARAEMMHTEVELATLVREVQSVLAPEIGDRRIEWHVGPLPVVRGDPSMLRLVILNLLQNAVKYTRGRDPARIVIDAEEDNGEWIVSVRDNGAGFDMKYADKLFGVFQRLHSVRQFEGTGIGLANVHRIISRHGGRTWATGRVDDGAEFFFSLPANA